ncbi:MAG: hypothetical protein PVG65_01950 [Candidatus Thorarchaeota archaeon]
MNVKIFSPQYTEVPLILAGVDAARTWFFKKAGVVPTEQIFVVVAEENNEYLFGYFDKRFIFIRPYDKEYIMFNQKTDRLLYSAMVSHEVAHYLLHYYNGYSDRVGHEYFAYVEFFEILPKNYKNKILKDYKKFFTPFDSIRQINQNYLDLSPMGFAVHSYAHNLHDKGELLRKILKGEFKPILDFVPTEPEREYFLPDIICEERRN